MLANGSSIEAPTQNTTYAITVTGPGGSTTCTVDVVVNPTINVIKEQSTDNLNWNTFAPGAPMIVSVGDTIYYRIRVSNTTQIGIQNLLISDNDLVDEPGLSCNYANFTAVGFSPSYNGSLTNPEWSV